MIQYIYIYLTNSTSSGCTQPVFIWIINTNTRPKKLQSKKRKLEQQTHNLSHQIPAFFDTEMPDSGCCRTKEHKSNASHVGRILLCSVAPREWNLGVESCRSLSTVLHKVHLLVNSDYWHVCMYLRMHKYMDPYNFVQLLLGWKARTTDFVCALQETPHLYITCNT